MDKNISALSMDSLFFEEISFKRIGDKQDSVNFTCDLEVTVGGDLKEDIYKVNLKMAGGLPNEYNLTISLIGIFSFSSEEKIPEELKEDLISKNAVAIMMPYLRSQVSLITAQPGVECVVLPPFNINNMMDDK